MNNEKWKKAVDKLVPLVPEIAEVLDDDLNKVNISVSEDGYVHMSIMIDNVIYSADRANYDRPVRINEPF